MHVVVECTVHVVLCMLYYACGSEAPGTLKLKLKHVIHNSAIDRHVHHLCAFTDAYSLWN